MTAEQANEMVEAAPRRVDRENEIVQSRRGLVDAGILANSDLLGFEDKLGREVRG